MTVPAPTRSVARGGWRLAAALTAFALLLLAVSGGDGSSPAAAAGRAPEARLAVDDPLALGALDAPVVMVVWGDFNCPFSARHAREVEPTLVSHYVNAGLLRIEWRDMPVLGAASELAARAARAAAAQGAFWEYAELLFTPELSEAELDAFSLAQLADHLGLDPVRFYDDLHDPAVAAAVAADFERGTQLGVDGTPTFLINDISIPGAYPPEEFLRVIEDELAAQRR